MKHKILTYIFLIILYFAIFYEILIHYSVNELVLVAATLIVAKLTFMMGGGNDD